MEGVLGFAEVEESLDVGVDVGVLWFWFDYDGFDDYGGRFLRLVVGFDDDGVVEFRFDECGGGSLSPGCRELCLSLRELVGAGVVVAVGALALWSADDAVSEALAVLLEAFAFLALAAGVVGGAFGGRGNFRVEGVGIFVEERFDRARARFHLGVLVLAADALTARSAELAGGEAVAVELQALAVLAVALLRRRALGQENSGSLLPRRLRRSYYYVVARRR